MSSVKTAKYGVKYIEGEVTDGTTNLRIVGFDEKLQATLSTLSQNKTPVKAEKCQIKRSRNEEFEILLNRSTNISSSPKKLKFSASNISPSPNTSQSVHEVSSIADITDVPDGEIVNVSGTVTFISPVRPVSTGLVQEVTITDSSGSITMSVWGNNIDRFQPSQLLSIQKVNYPFV